MQIISEVNISPSAQTIGKSCTTITLPAIRHLSPERQSGFIFTICFNIYALHLCIGGLVSLIKYRYKSSEDSALRAGLGSIHIQLPLASNEVSLYFSNLWRRSMVE